MTRMLDGYTYDFNLEQRYSPILKRPMDQLTVALPGGGCKYWIQTRGRGCLFCGFPGLTRQLNLGDGKEDYFGGWRLEADLLERMYRSAVESTPSFDKLAIFNGGSFFVDSELPPEFRAAVLKDASQRAHIQQVMVESRPEYLSDTVLDEAHPVLNAGQDFIVGIGVESAGDQVRNKLLMKGMHRNEIEKAFRRLRSRGIKIFAYAFLKAPGLNEKAALADILETMNYLTDQGVDEIALSCAFVPPDTPLEKEYRAGNFRPPWLWTVLAVIEEAQKQGWPISVGGFDDHPPPVSISHNCGECDATIMAEIEKFRHFGKHPNVARSCSCQATWSDLIGEEEKLQNSA